MDKRTLYGSPFPCLGTYLCSIFQSSVLSHYDLALCGSDSKSLTLVSLFFYPHLPSPYSTPCQKRNYGPRSLGQGLLMCFFFCLSVCLSVLTALDYSDVLTSWEPLSYSMLCPRHSKLGQMRELRLTERL